MWKIKEVKCPEDLDVSKIVLWPENGEPEIFVREKCNNN